MTGNELHLYLDDAGGLIIAAHVRPGLREIKRCRSFTLSANADGPLTAELRMLVSEMDELHVPYDQVTFIPRAPGDMIGN